MSVLHWLRTNVFYTGQQSRDATAVRDSGNVADWYVYFKLSIYLGNSSLCKPLYKQYVYNTLISWLQ